eukprot:CAMPEP_0114300218 /NCGR_PEP_ID=MMETSP0059-20121206/13426_1 /TAXON_ID=36894 /ORGANISM="Pyramimonas parkeae, Strain CCMP726" /LENGTH=268 /DNA_ID=CAMNT_0001422815 /DNA_START=131 /DNA_END=937 /DNA_ORIENTATION=+
MTINGYNSTKFADVLENYKTVLLNVSAKVAMVQTTSISIPPPVSRRRLLQSATATTIDTELLTWSNADAEDVRESLQAQKDNQNLYKNLKAQLPDIETFVISDIVIENKTPSPPPLYPTPPSPPPIPPPSPRPPPYSPVMLPPYLHPPDSEGSRSTDIMVAVLCAAVALVVIVISVVAMCYCWNLRLQEQSLQGAPRTSNPQLPASQGAAQLNGENGWCTNTSKRTWLLVLKAFCIAQPKETQVHAYADQEPSPLNKRRDSSTCSLEA